MAPESTFLYEPRLHPQFSLRRRYIRLAPMRSHWRHWTLLFCSKALIICQIAVKISKNVISERAFGSHFYLGPILYLLVSLLITVVLQAAQVSKRCGEAWKVAQKALRGNISFFFDAHAAFFPLVVLTGFLYKKSSETRMLRHVASRVMGGQGSFKLYLKCFFCGHV